MSVKYPGSTTFLTCNGGRTGKMHSRGFGHRHVRPPASSTQAPDIAWKNFLQYERDWPWKFTAHFFHVWKENSEIFQSYAALLKGGKSHFVNKGILQETSLKSFVSHIKTRNKGLKSLQITHRCNQWYTQPLLNIAYSTILNFFFHECVVQKRPFLAQSFLSPDTCDYIISWLHSSKCVAFFFKYYDFNLVNLWLST